MTSRTEEYPRPDRRTAARLLLLIAGILCGATGARADEKKLSIVAAASVRGVMDDLAAIYRKKHPETEVTVQSGGSTALARKVLDVELPADVIVLADASLFEDLLEPNWSDFHLRFAAERIVLAFNREAPGHERIDTDNWSEVLMDEDVHIGMANPDSVPVGYRTLMALRLADLHAGGGDKIEKSIVGKVGKRNQRADVAELLAPLQTGAFDYAFLYGATAKDAEVPFIELPDAINLSDPARAEEYAKVSVMVTGATPTDRRVKHGGPIVYGAALPRKNQSAQGREFLRLLLSDEGRRVLIERGFTPIRERKHLVRGVLPPELAAQLGIQ